MPQTVLVVDDERDIVELLRYHLTQAGFRVQSAGDGRLALEMARRDPPDLILLDLMLPVLPGTEVARLLRQGEKTRNVPIIMLTARGEEVDRVVGFELGADDYVVKPFSPREIVLRVQAVLRREEGHPEPTEERTMSFGDLVIDPASHTVSLYGKELDLTTTEFKLLERLARRPGRAFSRDQLLNDVWGQTEYIDPGTVTVHIRRLREKIEPDPSHPHFIVTVWGVGYRFEA